MSPLSIFQDFYGLTLIHVQSIFFFFILLRIIKHLPVKWNSVRGDSKKQLYATLALVGVVAYLFFRRLGWDYVGFAIELAMGFGLGLIYPASAFFFFLALELLRPWEFAGGTPLDGNSLLLALPRLGAGLVFVKWLMEIILSAKFRIGWNRHCTMMVLFSTWLLLSAIFSQKRGLALGSFKDSLPIMFFMFFLFVNLVTHSIDYGAARGTVIFAIGGLGVMALVGQMALYKLSPEGGFFSVKVRLDSAGAAGNANDLAALFVLAMPFCVAEFYQRRKSELGWLPPLLLIIISLLGVFFSQSRGAALGLIAMLSVVFALRFKRPLEGIILGSLPLLLIIPAQALLQREAGEAQESAEGRIYFWKMAIRMAVHNPLFGVGINNFPEELRSIDPSVGARATHSVWAQILAEAGFPGFFLFIIFVLGIGREAWGLRREYPELLISLVGYFVCISFLSHAYEPFPYLILGFVAAMARIKQRTQCEVLTNAV